MKTNSPDRTNRIIVTSENGDKLKDMSNAFFTDRQTDGVPIIEVLPNEPRQIMKGIGTSFTEASAFVLAHLDPSVRKDLMKEIYGENGANFSLARTHIGACDFTVKGRYSYADVKDDAALEHFTIDPDKKGFKRSEYPGIKDESYDLLPMIKEALEIKSGQKENDLRILGSAWTAPSWMKDIQDWYRPGSPENNWQGTGGSLKPQYIPLYAAYLAKYLQAYRNEGVPIWALTPVNEPHGVNGQWESMVFTPATQNQFIKKHLAPALKTGGFSDTRLYIYDQNRDGLEDWTNTIYADAETSPLVTGAAVHWYESTFRVYEDVFERVHAAYPDKSIMHTEGCIDDLGKDAPGGIQDPVKYKETGWFGNDAFWWNPNATDWAYTADWQGVNTADHPAYTPVHRYARNIIVSIDHWLEGWIDWNIVLDRKGGPNHVGNYCGAPVMIDTDSGEIYRTPIFYILSQFSRTIRPGDVALKTVQNLSMLPEDALHACATVNECGLVSVQLLNTTAEPITYGLKIGDRVAAVTIPANSVQTVQVQLDHPAVGDISNDVPAEEPFQLRPFLNDGPVPAVSYGPYRRGQAPGQKGPSSAEILEDLNIISEHWDMIRIYGSDSDAERILGVIEEYGVPVRVMLGIWLENETDRPDMKKANVEQVRKAAALANRYEKIIAGVNVGNESQVYWSGHRMDQQDLIRYIRFIRNAARVPVTTADDYNFWNKPEAQAVADEVDFIVAHIYPLWNGQTLESSIPWLDSVYSDLKMRFPRKELILGEIGWADSYNPNLKGPGQQGTLIKGEVGLKAQESFLDMLTNWSRNNGVTVFYFEAFDEPWKGGGDLSGPDEIEKHWGLFYEDRRPKESFKNFLGKRIE